MGNKYELAFGNKVRSAFGEGVVINPCLIASNAHYVVVAYPDGRQRSHNIESLEEIPHPDTVRLDYLHEYLHENGRNPVPVEINSDGEIVWEIHGFNTAGILCDLSTEGPSACLREVIDSLMEREEGAP